MCYLVKYSQQILLVQLIRDYILRHVITGINTHARLISNLLLGNDLDRTYPNIFKLITH